MAGDDVMARLALKRHFIVPERSTPIRSPSSLPKTIRSLVTAGLLRMGAPASNFQTKRPVFSLTAYSVPSSLPKKAWPRVAFTLLRIGALVLQVLLIFRLLVSTA